MRVRPTATESLITKQSMMMSMVVRLQLSNLQSVKEFSNMPGNRADDGANQAIGYLTIEPVGG